MKLPAEDIFKIYYFKVNRVYGLLVNSTIAIGNSRKIEAADFGR